jgi:hypothetical protein
MVDLYFDNNLNHMKEYSINIKHSDDKSTKENSEKSNQVD